MDAQSFSNIMLNGAQSNHVMLQAAAAGARHGRGTTATDACRTGPAKHDACGAPGAGIVENPPLARSLYRTVEIGRMIPPDLFRAVAEVLAFVFRQRAMREINH